MCVCLYAKTRDLILLRSCYADVTPHRARVWGSKAELPPVARRPVA